MANFLNTVSSVFSNVAAIAKAPKMYIKRGSVKYQVPVLPESFALSFANDIQTINIVNKGEMAIPGGRKLVTFGFSSFLPKTSTITGYKRYAPWVDPAAFCKQVKSWMNNKQYVRVIVTGTKANINKLFYIDTFEYGISDGSGDVEYSISFTEYRQLKVIKSTKKKSNSDGSGRTTDKTTKSTYTVRAGDTVTSIAKSQYGANTTANRNKLIKLNNLKKSTVTGYVKLSNCEQQNYTEYKTTATVNLRKGAGTSYTLIKTLKSNTIVKVTKFSSDKAWGYTTLGGWIYLKYAKVTGNSYWKVKTKTTLKWASADAVVNANELIRVTGTKEVSGVKYGKISRTGYNLKVGTKLKLK